MALARAPAPAPLVVPIRHIVDSRAGWTTQRISHFWSSIWPEAVRDFASSGIQLQSSVSAGEIRRTAGDRPNFIGPERGVLNVVLTDQIPLRWSGGRALCGVTTRYDGYDLCLIAVNYAHGNQIPFVSLNTCVHELLHALMHDIFDVHPSGFSGQIRELRIDWLATRLWLFHDSGAIRQSAQSYVEYLRAQGGK